MSEFCCMYSNIRFSSLLRAIWFVSNKWPYRSFDAINSAEFYPVHASPSNAIFITSWNLAWYGTVVHNSTVTCGSRKPTYVSLRYLRDVRVSLA
jgi:hypothetical protein